MADGEGGDLDLSEAPIDDVLASLSTSTEGLSGDEAARRLEEHGPNAIPEKHENAVAKFLGYFWGPIPWMIEAALVLAGALGDWTDVVVIGVLLLLNGVVGFWEEHQAGNAIAALKEKLATETTVRRDGAWGTADARTLVPGDIIRVRLGDVVPADARLVGDGEVELDQAALTGESLPVKRQRGGVAYSGSVATKGETDAVVVSTGADTFFGRTAQLVESAGGAGHFQQAVLSVGRYLILFAVGLVLVTLVAGLLRGNPAEDMIEFALVLTIAGVPIALPAVLSVTMAVGAGNLAKRDVVVSHLPAVEEVGGITVLCSDKTGTLTQNKLAVSDPFLPSAGGESNANDLLVAAALCSRAEDRDPIDLAVLAGVAGNGALDGYNVDAFTPFDPVNKRSEAEVSTPDGRHLTVTKGAPQAVLALVPDDAPDHEQLVQEIVGAVDDLAGRGFRALGVARREGGGAWEMLGVLPLSDPPREDSKSTIESAEALGVEVKMVTGDNIAIAKEVATEVGLGNRILDAGVLEDDDDEALTDTIEGADGFAQVFPEHKYRIVQLLQRRDNIVGMTGDGVNDAPALQQADAGIAVSGAPDAARAAADLVLLTPGLSVIVDAITASRKIFHRMTSYTLYRICETIALLFFVAIVMLAFNEQPVTSTMILLLAVLNDGAILSIAYDRASAAGRPQAWDMRMVLTISTVLGFYVVGTSLLLWILGRDVFDLDLAVLQTMIYLKLSVAGHLTVFATRVRGPFWSVQPSPILLWAVLGTQALATLIAVFGFGLVEPLPLGWAAFVWAFALAGFLVQDRVKLVAYGILESRREEPATG